MSGTVVFADGSTAILEHLDLLTARANGTQIVILEAPRCHGKTTLAKMRLEDFDRMMRACDDAVFALRDLDRALREFQLSLDQVPPLERIKQRAKSFLPARDSARRAQRPTAQVALLARRARGQLPRKYSTYQGEHA